MSTCAVNLNNLFCDNIFLKSALQDNKQSVWAQNSLILPKHEYLCCESKQSSVNLHLFQGILIGIHNAQNINDDPAFGIQRMPSLKETYEIMAPHIVSLST